VAHYIKNADLLREINESKKTGVLTPAAVEMFIKLAHETSRKLRYKDQMDREDCISSALEDLLRYWKGFDSAKSTNAFAYFTQITKNGFGKGMKKLHNPLAGQHLSLSDNIYNI
jgi:hypothetical protein